MSVEPTRVRAIVRKEFREYRATGRIVVAMAIFPLIFLIQPLIEVFPCPTAASRPRSSGARPPVHARHPDPRAGGARRLRGGR